MEKFVMERTGIDVTWKCNLNCRLCAAFIPFESKELYDFSISSLKDSIDQYFKIVSYVNKLTVTGGEPFLYPDLDQFIRYLKNYCEQIGTIEIITNGSIIPNRNFLEAAKDFGPNISFLIDNYGSKLSSKAQEIAKLLSSLDLPNTIRNYTGEGTHCGGWTDFGDLTRPACKSQEAELTYSKCAYPQKLKFCFSITGPYMTPCPPVRRCKELNITDNYEEYIDLFDSTLSVEEQRQKIRNIYQKKSLSACAHCQGMCDDSQRFPPAQQLTKQELLCIKAGAKTLFDVREMLEENEEVS